MDMTTARRAEVERLNAALGRTVTYGCNVKILGKWHRVEFDSEAVLDLAIAAFEAKGYEVA